MQHSGGKTKGNTPLDESLEKPESLVSNNKVEDTFMGNDFLKLRKLLLGDDYSEAIQRYINKEKEVERIVEDLPAALKKSSQDDLSETLAPVLDQAFEKSIEQNPSRITNIIFPIMGPAIRKSVASALAEMVQSLNTLLEQSLTLGSLGWRFRAWRSGMPYANYVLLQTLEYRVEQVLLVHKETGLLLHSVTAAEVQAQAQDPELVSSMLTAISDFVSDSFSDGSETLERIRFGDLELHLNVGPQAILAIAVRGSASDEVFLKAQTTIETIHSHYANQLNHFEGDRTSFEDTDPILSECLLTQKNTQKTKSKPWLACILILGLCIYLVYQGIESFQRDKQYKQLENFINNEPGYVVISSQRKENHLFVKALRSSESRLPIDFQLDLTKDKSIDLVLDAKEVHFGPLPLPIVPEIKEKSANEEIQDLVDDIQNTTFYFEAGEINLSEIELLKIPSLIKNISELERLIDENQLESLQVILMGFADSSGSSSINNKISLKRANELKSLLSANKISSDIIVAWGAGNIDRATVSNKVQRRVTVQVLFTRQNLQDDKVSSSKNSADKGMDKDVNQGAIL